MRDGSTQHLIEELSHDLQPVRPVPSLRVTAARVACAALAVGALVAAWVGLRPDLADLASRSLSFTAMGLGLLIAAVGGVVAALAERTPGREHSASLGGAAMLIGLGGAIGSAFAAWWSVGFASQVGFAADRVCFEAAILYALLPSAALLLSVLRGWVARPVRAAAFTLAGGVACGALIIHLSCPVDGERHMLVGHLLPPLLIAVAGALPLAAWLRRSAR